MREARFRALTLHPVVSIALKALAVEMREARFRALTQTQSPREL